MALSTRALRLLLMLGALVLAASSQVTWYWLNTLYYDSGDTSCANDPVYMEFAAESKVINFARTLSCTASRRWRDRAGRLRTTVW